MYYRRRSMWRYAAGFFGAACILALLILYGCTQDGYLSYDSNDAALTIYTEGSTATNEPDYSPEVLPDSSNQGKILSIRLDAGSIHDGIPVLVCVSDRNFLAECGEELEKLSIYSAENQSLAFELDSYDNETGEAYIWVKPPSSGTDLFLYSGSAPEFNSTEHLWGDWELVLHMNEGKTGATEDSSPNSHKITSSKSGVTFESGGLGTAAIFDGKAGYFVVDSTLAPPSSSNNKNSYRDTGYVKPSNWEYAQGLTTDGTYIYFAGHHDKTGEGCSIHKIRISDMTEVAVFEKTGPMHGAELAYAADRGTLFASTGGEGRAAEVWEMNINDGSVIDKWDFSKIGYGAAAAVAYCGDGEIILFTSVGNGERFALDRIRLKSGGDFVILGSWIYKSGEDPGVPQGLEYRDGYVYLLADAGATIKVDPHFIYKIKLDPSTATPEIIEKYLISINAETEGLFFSADGRVYFGTNEEKIYVFDDTYDKLKPYVDPSPSDGAFSLMCMIYVDSLPNKYPHIIGFGAESGNKNALALHLMESLGGTVRFGITIDGTWTRFDSPQGSLKSGWNSIIATYDGTVMKLYINGNLAGELAASGIPADQGGRFSIGADIENGSLSYFFSGKIDEVRYTRRIFTADEIKAIHNNITQALS